MASKTPSKHRLAVELSEKREKDKEKTRSPHWPAVRNHFLANNKTCHACGSAEKIQVHHVEPFNEKPELELEPTNFIALCMGPNECHLEIGHGGSFDFFNPNVRQDADALQKDLNQLAQVRTAAMKNRKPNVPAKSVVTNVSVTTPKE